MTRWIRLVHTYTGLFNFTALTLFGVVGVIATVLPPHDQRPSPEPVVELHDLEVPGGLDDRQLADHIHAALAIPYSKPPPDWSLRRDSEHDLTFLLATPAREHKVVVLEDEGRLRIETRVLPAWQVLLHLHETVPSRAAPDYRLQAWAWYLELSIWSLILMAASGLYLWLASRPRHRWAQVCLVVGSLVFVGFYWFVR